MASPDTVPARWGSRFDPDRLAILELRMWKAYYRRQGPRLFGLLVMTLREQGGAYGVPTALVAEAGRLRGRAAEIRDRGAAEDPDGPTGAGRAYWPEVASLLRESYGSLSAAVRPGSA